MSHQLATTAASCSAAGGPAVCPGACCARAREQLSSGLAARGHQHLRRSWRSLGWADLQLFTGCIGQLLLTALKMTQRRKKWQHVRLCQSQCWLLSKTCALTATPQICHLRATANTCWSRLMPAVVGVPELHWSFFRCSDAAPEVVICPTHPHADDTQRGQSGKKMCAELVLSHRQGADGYVGPQPVYFL